MSRLAPETAVHAVSAHAHQAPDRRRWADVLKHRWPTWLGIATAAFFIVIAEWLPPDFGAWMLVLAALVYLVFGAVRKQLRSPGLLALETAGVLVFSTLALAALSVDQDLGRYLLAAGWLGHAAWDFAHHRADKVVPRWYAELCAVVDVLIAAFLIVIVPML